MKTEKILLTVTVPAAAALTRFRMVSYVGNVPAAGDPVLGVADADYTAGEQAGVNTHGEILVEAGGPISEGDELTTDAVGRAVANSEDYACGVARDSASGAGEIIRMLPVQSGVK